MQELISVIVPMYNAEKTIERCVKSILIQEDVDYEILIIDDGSEDNSLKICYALEKEYNNIKVYHTKNMGASHARNVGLEKAEGKWVVFLDADDELVKGVLFCAQEMQKKYMCDTVCWNAFSVVKNVCHPYEEFHIGSDLIKKEDIDDLMESLYHVPSSKNRFYGTLIRASWGKMYLLEIIRKNKIKFPEKMLMGEDAVFLFEYFHHCSLIAFLNRPLYKYYEIENSITGRYKKNYFEIQKAEAIAIKRIYLKYGMEPEKALVCFWNIAFMDYIQNEYKASTNDLNVILKANNYLKKDIVRKYLVKVKSKSKFSVLKSKLVACRCTCLVAFIYVSICKIRMQKAKRLIEQ